MSNSSRWQISLKIYDISEFMSASETNQFLSMPFSCMISDRIRSLLYSLSPVTEILDIKVQNQTMFSFELDSARISSGLKLVTAMAGTQVCMIVFQHDVIAPDLPEF
jgi:hypothetical protein